MSKMIKVTAAPGRVVPIHPSTKAGIGGRLLRITEGDEVDLPCNVFVRRRLAAGDLVEVKSAPVARVVTKPDRPSKES
jgi:hypothetical protein